MAAASGLRRNAGGCGLCGHRPRPSAQRPIAMHWTSLSKRQPSLAFSAAEDQAAVQAPEPSTPPEQPVEAPVVDDTPETVFYESSGSAAELAISLVLGLTLVYAPLTLASIGRHLWIKVRFTSKRVTVTNTSPLFKNEVSVAYTKVKEIRTVQRGLGLWGDMVIFLKDGARLELTGLEKCAEIKRYVESCIYD